jgi:CDP-6-deoxy-D-xylo-4-hexulose-3-dehydrase
MFTPVKDRIEYGGAIMGKLERDAMFRVFDSQKGRRWTIGPESEAFESELAKTTGVARAVVTNSGSSALLVGLSALKLPKGSLVAVPCLNFPTAFNAIMQAGYKPVVVDIDPKTMNLDLEQVRTIIGQGLDIKAVVGVDVAGNPIDLVKLREIVGNQVYLVLDDCDGFGTTLNGRFVDAYADVSCVSFHAAHIITTGEGGAILTDNQEIADRAKKMREWGRASGTDNIYRYPGFPDDYRERYVYEEIGYNVKPLELQCAIGRIQLRKLGWFKQRRAENFGKLMAVFAKLPKFAAIEWPENSEPCWFSFPFYCRGVKRGLVMDTLEKNNIECRTIFSGNILKHPAYKDIDVVRFDPYPNADDVMFNGMFISVHPSINDEMIAFIEKVLGEL